MASVGYFLLMATLAIMEPSPFAVDGDDERSPDGGAEKGELSIDPGHLPDGQ